jgi:modulator of FtsH protease
MQEQTYNQYSVSAQHRLETSKVLRNTYALLSMTLVFSALMAGIAMAAGVGRGLGLVFSIAALVLIWFVLPKTANSSKGILVVFAFTGLLGAALGPMLSYYLSLSNGGLMVMQALGGTGLVFLSLSAYVVTTRKDFSFMGGFLFIGIIVALLGMVGMLIAALFGVEITMFSLGLSMLMVFLMSGFMLYDTSRIINGGETNYLMATTSLYLNIYAMFNHLLNILGIMNND